MWFLSFSLFPSLSSSSSSSCLRPLVSVHNTNNGISLNSRFEQQYSPSNTMSIIPNICIIHQSHVDGQPSYTEHRRICIRKRVTEKSRHFFDFSTMIASNNDLQMMAGSEEWKVRQKKPQNDEMRVSPIVRGDEWAPCQKFKQCSQTYPIMLDVNTAALSIHPKALQISKNLEVNIRSSVMLVANNKWLIWNIIPRTT